MKQIKIFIIVINIGLLAAQFLLANLRTTDGDQLASLNSQLSETSNQNRQLQSLIYSSSSLAHIYSSASSLQLVPLDVELSFPHSVAQGQTLNP